MKNIKFQILRAACLAGLAAGIPLQAAIVPVTSAVASSNWQGTSLILTNTINGSGITGSMATEADLGVATHDNHGSAATMWHSEIVPEADMLLTWNFTAASTVRTLYYWNHNQNNSTDRGIQQMELLYSTNGGAEYQSAGNFTLIRANGTAAERPNVLDLVTPLAGVTNIRFRVISDFGGIVTGLAEIRFSDIAPVEPKPILTLSSNFTVTYNEVPVDLTYYTERVTSPTISPAPGAVGVSGVTTVTPPSNADTVYTLSGSSSTGPVSTSVTVRTVADTGGAVTYRYVRFTQRKLRNDATANSIQLAKFYLVNEGAIVDPEDGIIATNPGGDNPANQGPAAAVDNDPVTKWLDFNKAPLVLDFGAPTTFDAYGFTTGGDAIERDPVRWIIEGSNNNTDWTLVENITTFDYPTPLARSSSTSDIPLPGATLAPTLAVRGDTKVIAGEPLPLFWSTEGAAFVTLNDGSGPVPTATLSGNIAVSPVANTTYTFVATGPTGKTATASVSVTPITPAITTIDYANFDAAGDELALIGSAVVLADATRPLPGPNERLRLTADAGGQTGAAWFRKRQQFSAGFETTFAIHFTTLGATSGADGMAFVIHNRPDGTLAMPAGTQENGFPEQALNIKFDSYQNPGDLSNAVVQVLNGTAVVATADLSTFPGITFPGALAGDLTDNSALGAPHIVRIAYFPGNLDVYVDDILVINSAVVDLANAGAVNGSGFGYAGFTSRTGGFFEAHDVTSWSLVEGPPPPQLEILAHAITGNQVTLTWASDDTRTYKITASTDLQDWSTVLASGISGAAGQGQTTSPAPFTPGTKLFFRVEEE